MIYDQESAIVWERDPNKFPFVRVVFTLVPYRKKWRNRWTPSDEIIVGYAEIWEGHRGWNGRFWRRRFVVRNCDYPFGDGYAPPKSPNVPCEAVDPLTLAPNVSGSVTERCFRVPTTEVTK